MLIDDVIEVVYNSVPASHPFRKQVIPGLTRYVSVSQAVTLSADTVMAFLCGSGQFLDLELAAIQSKIVRTLGKPRKGFQSTALPILHSSYTLSQLRDWTHAGKVSGESFHCAVCDQTVKIYKRDLNGVMAKILCLINFYFKNNPEKEWLHVDKFLQGFGMNVRYFSLMAHWGLLEKKLEIRDDGSDRSGFWRITDKGKDFVAGKISVPEYFYMYNAEVDTALGVQGWSGTSVTIHGALQKGKFDYQEIQNLFP